MYENNGCKQHTHPLTALLTGKERKGHKEDDGGRQEKGGEKRWRRDGWTDAKITVTHSNRRKRRRNTRSRAEGDKKNGEREK